LLGFFYFIAMQFTTPIPIPKAKTPISYDSEIISLGSCFAVNIAEKFEYFKFQNSCNPFGILFHPLAIHEIIRKSLTDEKFTAADIFYHNELWHCFDVHSELSNPNKEILLENLNQLLQSTREQISNATHIIITYGTSWVYRDNTSLKAAANCHKVPQSHFTKELLSVGTIQTTISDTIALIGKANPKCAIIFTVSPVRHIKDGFVENQHSKANLITALHSALLTESNLPLSYFPSYEIMMDELRDYRFYAEDMLHPNTTAVDYIWERFSETHISDNAKTTMHEVKTIQKALQHKPFHLNSESHKQFVSKINQAITRLQENFPSMRF
jgi:hypothetical protein